jgi:hypothetical protein
MPVDAQACPRNAQGRLARRRHEKLEVRAWGLPSVRPALALAFALAFALAPSVHAQTLPASPVMQPAQLSVFVEDPGHALAPGKVEPLDIGVNYNVPAGGQPTPDPSNNDTSAQPTRVTFAVKTLPPWVTNVTFVPSTVNISFPLGSPNAAYAAKAKALLTIDPKAPALDKREFVITATAQPNGNIGGASAESPSINLKPGFVPKVNVTAPTSMVVKGGRWTDMPFTIQNLGNHNTTVKLNVTARPQDSEVEFPTSVNVSVDGSQVVHVRLRIPWTYGEGGTLEVEATPLAISDDSQDGKPARANIDVNGQSAVPGVELPAALLSVGTLALLLRRRS